MSAGRSNHVAHGRTRRGQTAAGDPRNTEIGMRSVAVKYQSAMECSRRMPPAGRGAIHAEALDARADQGAGGTMAGAIRGAPQVQRRPRAPRGAAKGTARIPEALGLPSEEDASRAYLSEARESALDELGLCWEPPREGAETTEAEIHLPRRTVASHAERTARVQRGERPLQGNPQRSEAVQLGA